MIEQITVDGVKALYVAEKVFWLDTPGYWVLEGQGINGATTMRTREEAEARCRDTALVDSVKCKSLSRAEYEAQCQQYAVLACPDEEIQRGAYGLTYGCFALPEYSAKQIVERKLAQARLHAINETARSQPSEAQNPAAMGMVRSSTGWVDEDQWLEAQERGIDL